MEEQRTWRCAQCGEVIGVYERAVAVENAEARETSKLGEPGYGTPAGDLYHANCWIERSA